VVTAALLAGSGWWLLLALVPFVIGRVAYLGAVQAAVAYGESVRAAFDLHRFDLLTALHLPLPPDAAAERLGNTELCDRWRQGSPTGTVYHHPEPTERDPSPASGLPRSRRPGESA
ncbi:MAG: hypothetical protein ABIS86_18155, partial [Streptosporangiaceae bacterium]